MYTGIIASCSIIKCLSKHSTTQEVEKPLQSMLQHCFYLNEYLNHRKQKTLSNNLVHSLIVTGDRRHAHITTHSHFSYTLHTKSVNFYSSYYLFLLSPLTTSPKLLFTLLSPAPVDRRQAAPPHRLQSSSSIAEGTQRHPAFRGYSTLQQ